MGMFTVVKETNELTQRRGWGRSIGIPSPKKYCPLGYCRKTIVIVF
jgi:hypothetical protein